MKPSHTRTSFALTSLLLIAINVLAAAGNDKREGEGAMRVLMCNPPDGNKAVMFEWEKLESTATKNANGSLTIIGPVKYGDVCIRDIQVWAAFGAVSVTGALCSNDVKPLLRLVQSFKPKLTKPVEGMPPGIIASLSDEKYSFFVFKGVPSITPEPNIKSQQISFMCGFGSGNAQ